MLRTVLHRDLIESNLHLPGAHTHDDRYYTESESDARFTTPSTVDLRYGYKDVWTVGKTGTSADYVCDGNDDQTEIYAAITAASVGGGIVYLLKGTYTVTSPIVLKSNVTLHGPGSTLTSTMSFSLGRGVITVSNQTNVEVRGLAFTLGGLCTGVTSHGHDGLHVLNCRSTGSSAVHSVIFLNGGNGTANFLNTLIDRCRFTNLPSASRCVRFYPRNGWILDGATVQNSYFKNTCGPYIFVDAYDTVRDVRVVSNTALDVINGDTVNKPAVLFITIISSNGAYFISGLTIDGNYYRNSRTTNTRQGCIFFYECKNIRVTNNTMIGAWTPTTNVQGPAIASGRTNYPAIGIVIAGNFTEGFNSPWDPDSMRICDCHDNVVYRCRGTRALGYNTQEYIRIHDNTHYNCWDDLANPFTTFITLTNSAGAKKCLIYNNTYVDDTASPRPIWFIELTGNDDFSDVTIMGNTAYLPNGTITSYVKKELGSEVMPRLIEGNEVHDSTGVTREYLMALGNKTGAFNVAPAAGAAQTMTLTGTITPTISSGTFIGQELNLRFTQDATGSRTIIWPSNVKKAGGSLALSAAAGAVDIVTLRWDDTNWIEMSRSLNVS